MAWSSVFRRILWPGRKISRAGLSLLGLAILFALGLILIFTLAQSTSNQSSYERYYNVLFVVNVVVAILLLGVLVWAAVRLLRGLRKGSFGSQLWLKLAVIFVSVGVLPGSVVYIVSYQFVSRSIESWFDVRVEGALSAGLNLGGYFLENRREEVGRKTRLLAKDLATSSPVQIALALERLREQYGFNEVVVWKNGNVLASAGISKFRLSWPKPSDLVLERIQKGEIALSFEGLENEDVVVNGNESQAHIEAWVRIINYQYDYALTSKDSYLMATQSLAPGLVRNALAVQSAYQEYQERSLARQGLRRMYIGTLSLALFLAVLTAVLLAYLLGRQLLQPLLLLAQGVQQVARGDLQPKPTSAAKDELGGLTRSFASMTQQLLEARQDVQRSMSALNSERHRVQTILDNLSAAVMLLDNEGRLVLVNPSASHIFGINFAQQQGIRLEQIVGMEVLGKKVHDAFESWHPQSQAYWQQSFEMGENTTLIARGTRMRDNELLLMFNDISEVVSAERIQAWAEVAQRLAHEIKNPLTPIQLSAERLEQKLKAKLPAPEQNLLKKSIHTIVVQVKAMKCLVNEFRDFGRLPAVQLKPLSLNVLILEVLSLYANSEVPIECDLDTQDLWIQGDDQQLRQVIHNLLQNAQDACEGRAAGLVQIQTRASENQKWLHLIIVDNGPGFHASTLNRAFEAYVTTKSKGTGLGLAMVKKIADKHRAKATLTNVQKFGKILGAQVVLSFKVAV